MKNRSLFSLSLLLSLPLVIFLLKYYLIHSPDLIPTGFTQSDNVVYIADARQHLETKFSITYSNPFDYSLTSPSIYSQPYNFILCLFLLLHFDPGFALSLFGILSAIFCIFFSLKVVDYLYPAIKNKILVFLFMIWGGGLIAVAGLAASNFIFPHKFNDFWSGIYLLDPGNGWWGMNFGRTFIIPVEAFYHLLFISAIFLTLKHRWKGAFILSFLLCWTHPFTGSEYLCIIVGWIFVEKIIVRNNNLPWAFCIGMFLLFCLHFGYYILFLNQFEEHKKLFNVFSASWRHPFQVFIPAYILVAALAVYHIFKSSLKRVFNSEHQRLFFCWAIIAFLLSKHEWFIKPIQPIHFTRGYPWLGLFLFCIPALPAVFNCLRNKLLQIIFILIFLSDNLLWYTVLLSSKPKSESEAYVRRDTKEILQWFAAHATLNDLIVSNEYLVSYMANAYGPSRSWTGHIYNTPDFDEKKKRTEEFFRTAVPLTEWNGRRTLLLINKNKATPLNPLISRNRLFENDSYIIFKN